jgi:ribonucleoside-diphosphate reductase alpha chain
MCEAVLCTGARRGAIMATLRCDHPDIDAFVSAKNAPGKLRHFNLSVQVTDAFMSAVQADTDWPLVFPAAALEGDGETVLRDWPGEAVPVPCRVINRVRARLLWESILRSAYDTAEPGVLFIDRINRLNNLWYRERIAATNPCGEVPLPPYGACDLGSINLTQFVIAPFTREARLDLGRLQGTARVATRFLDNVIEASRFPLAAQAEVARATRRIGLGITGLADAFVMLGIRYGSERSVACAATAMRYICHAAYQASIGLAREKGPFPEFERDQFLAGPFIRALPEELRTAIAQSGIRNSHLMAIAPTGSISLLAGNVSSGIEPIFAPAYCRTVRTEDGGPVEFRLEDYALRRWRETRSGGTDLPDAFVAASGVSPAAQIDMQSALQTYVDNAISKTVSVPREIAFEEVRRIYELAYEKGLKGCTTFRPTPLRGAVLESGEPSAPHCCQLERAADSPAGTELALGGNGGQ